VRVEWFSLFRVGVGVFCLCFLTPSNPGAVGYNKLTSLPAEIGQLTSLTLLDGAFRALLPSRPGGLASELCFVLLS
jgi:hypothetical protein